MNLTRRIGRSLSDSRAARHGASVVARKETNREARERAQRRMPWSGGGEPTTSAQRRREWHHARKGRINVRSARNARRQWNPHISHRRIYTHTSDITAHMQIHKRTNANEDLTSRILKKEQKTHNAALDDGKECQRTTHGTTTGQRTANGHANGLQGGNTDVFWLSSTKPGT